MRTFILPFLFIFFLFCASVNAQINDSINTKKLLEVEVSAQMRPSVSQSTTPLQSIGSESILKQGMQAVSDAVRRFNGIVLKDYGGIGGLKTISIRGMGAEHTAVSYDGVVVSNMQSGQVDISRFTLDNVSAVSLSISQSDNIFQTAKAFASGGILNLETTVPAFNEQNHTGYIKITGGSFGLFNPAVDYAHKLSSKLSVSMNGNWLRSDGSYPFTQDDDKLITYRKRKNSDVNIVRSEANLYGDFGKSGEFKAKFYYYDSERGLPNGVILGNDHAVGRLWDKNFFVQTSYDKDLNRKLQLKTQAKYDYTYTKYIDTQKRQDNRNKEQEVYLSNSLLYTYNQKLSVSFSQDVSFNKLKNEIESFGTNLPYPERYNSLSVLAFKYETKRITVSSNALVTYITEKVKNNKSNTTYTKLSPSIGISVLPLKSLNLRLRTSYKHVFRVPTFTELYYSSIDKNILPESAKQFNMGLTWMGSIASSPINYLNLSVDGYYNKVDNKIVIIPKLPFATIMNMGKVDIKGIDINLAANISVTSDINIDLSTTYSLMQALDLTDKTADNYKNQIPYTPKHSGATSITINNPWLTVSYSIIASDKRYRLPANLKENKVNGYTDHGIALYKEFKLKNYKTYMQGNIQNIWNKNYDIIAYYPMPGRSFKLSTGLKF